VITLNGMIKALFVMESSKVISINEEEIPVWMEVIGSALPMAEDGELMEVARALCEQSEDKQQWISTRTVLTELRKVRGRNIQTAERYARQIERTGTNVTDINLKQIMADTSRGMTPQEVASRAQERAQ